MEDVWKITKNLKNKVKVSQISTNKANAGTEVTNREGVDVLIFSPKIYITTFSDVNIDLPLQGFNEYVAFKNILTYSQLSLRVTLSVSNFSAICNRSKCRT